MKIRIGRLVIEAKITPTALTNLDNYIATEGFYEDE